MDVVAVQRAIEADCIITDGFHLRQRTLDNIAKAQQRRGIIILTDPDAAGERIRKFLAKRFPKAKHAFIPKEEATANDDIGVEQASPESIRKALAVVRTERMETTEIFTARDLARHGLSGAKDAEARRAKAGALLGLGYANAKTFLRRLNHYGVTREEFAQAMQKLSAEEAQG